MASTRVVGRVSVRVMPDTRRFKSDLQKSLQRLERTLEVKIPTVLDNKRLREQALQAKRDAERAAGDLEISPVLVDTGDVARDLARITRQRTIDLRLRVQNLARIAAEIYALSSIFRRPLSITLRAAGIGAIIAALGVAVNSSTTLIANLLAINGVVGLMPALAVAAGAGIAALVVGFQGFGDALSSDTAKASEALADLTPSARAAAVELRSFGPLLGRIQDVVQERLFAGWAPDLAIVGRNLLPPIGNGLAAIAQSANAAGTNLLRALSTRQMASDLNLTLTNTAGLFANMAPATGAWANAFRDLAAVGSSFLPQLGASIASVSERFAAFIANARADGSLREWMQAGITAARDLFSVLGGLGRILAAVGRAAQAAGGTNLAGLATVLHDIADTMNTPAFQGGLTSVFTSLQQAFSNLGTAVGPISDMFIALAPTLGMVAEAAGATLASALTAAANTLNFMAPVLEKVGSALQVIGPVIGGLAPAVLIMVGAFKAFNAVMAITNALMYANPVTLVVLAIGALILAVVALYQNFEPFREIVNTTWAALKDGFLAAWEAIKPIWDELMVILRDSWPQIQEVISAFWEVVKGLFELYVTYIQGVIQGAVAIILFIWNNFGTQIVEYVTAAWNMIVGVISGVLEMIKGVIDVVMGVITGDWSRAWNGIKSILSGAWKVITSLVTGAVGMVKSIISAAWKVISSVTKSVWNGIKAFFTGVWNGILAFIRERIGAVRRTISGAWNTVKSLTTAAWNFVTSAISSRVSSILSTVRGIPGRIRTALGNTGRMLRQAGRNIIQGLINGITSMLGKISESMSSAVDRVRDYLPWSPAKRGPLRSHPPARGGRNIVRMMADGIASGRGLVDAAMTRVTSTAVLPSDAAAAAGLPVGSAGSGLGGRAAPSADMAALVAAVEALAAQPVVVQVDSQEIARATRSGERQLARR